MLELNFLWTVKLKRKARDQRLCVSEYFTEKGKVDEKFQEIWSVHIELRRWMEAYGKGIKFSFYFAMIGCNEINFIANLSSPQKKHTNQIQANIQQHMERTYKPSHCTNPI